MTVQAGQGEARWEYAMLNWEGGGMGKHRSLHFTHRPDVDQWWRDVHNDWWPW